MDKGLASGVKNKELLLQRVPKTRGLHKARVIAQRAQHCQFQEKQRNGNGSLRMLLR